MLLDTAHQTLENILTLPELEEDALDYMGCLGAMAAFIITPKDIDLQTITEHVLDETIDRLTEDQLNQLTDALTVIHSQLSAQFEEEEDLLLPWMEEDEEEEDALISWAAGFVEVVFSYEPLWFNSQFEENVTQLLMPIFTISGILEEETEDITNNDQLLSQWIDEIPDLLIDLYLLFRVTDEKKAPPKNVYGASKSRTNKSSNKKSGSNKSNQKKRGSRGNKAKKK